LHILRFLWVTLKKTIRRFHNDGCNVEARSLSYVSLLALIPLLVVIVFELRNLSFFPALKDRLIIGISNYFLPDKARGIISYMDTVLESTGSVGIIGIVFSIAITFSLFFSLSKSVNYIWREYTTKSLLRNSIKFIIIIVCTPVFIIITFFLQNYVSFQNLGALLPSVPFFTVKATQQGFSLLLNWLLLAAIFALIPHCRVRPLYSLFTGVVSGTLWFFLRLGLNIYVKLIPQINVLYGSLAFIPIFLVWIYASWIIVLFGVELNYTFHFDLK